MRYIVIRSVNKLLERIHAVIVICPENRHAVIVICPENRHADSDLSLLNTSSTYPWPHGAMVARLTPDQKVGCSSHSGVNFFFFSTLLLVRAISIFFSTSMSTFAVFRDVYLILIFALSLSMVLTELDLLENIYIVINLIFTCICIF